MSGNPMRDTVDREVIVTRMFDAPAELIFDAFTDPEHITHWWGPVGFSTTTTEMDLRPGGVWRFVMHGPDGRDYQNKVIYREVDRPRLLAYAHTGNEEELGDVAFEVVTTFEQCGEQTHVTMRSLFPNAEGRRKVVEEYGAIEGGYDTLNRLAQHLAKTRGQLVH